VVIERLRHNSAFVQHGPEFVAAASVIVADTNGGFARIAADDYQLHAFAEMVGKCSHYASLLCLLILLLTGERERVLFDMGRQTATGYLIHSNSPSRAAIPGQALFHAPWHTLSSLQRGPRKQFRSI
jgi:hypothetical protein